LDRLTPSGGFLIPLYSPLSYIPLPPRKILGTLPVPFVILVASPRILIFFSLMLLFLVDYFKILPFSLFLRSSCLLIAERSSEFRSLSYCISFYISPRNDSNAFPLLPSSLQEALSPVYLFLFLAIVRFHECTPIIGAYGNASPYSLPTALLTASNFSLFITSSLNL